MLVSVSETVLGFLPPLLTLIVSVGASSTLIFFAVKLIKRQFKLYNSIRLVELKSSKLRYWAFILFIGFFIFYLASQIFDPEAPERVLMISVFKMKNWQYNLTLTFALILCLSAALMFLALALSKSAVVDKGVYTEFSYIDWYHVHDYIIDEDRGIVILSSNKDTFQTLKGTTPPMKVAANDIPKLKFILNKNKNKFSGRDDDVRNPANRW